MKKILIGADAEKVDWVHFLKEYLNDVSCEIDVFHTSHEILEALKINDYHLSFIHVDILSLPLAQKIRALQQIECRNRFISIGENLDSKHQDIFCASFPSPPDINKFGIDLSKHFFLPSKIDVLITDDEIDIRDMVEEYLGLDRQIQFEVRKAENGKVSKEFIETRLPDVLILDIKMPIMTGREVLLWIKESEIDIPIIVFFDTISPEALGLGGRKNLSIVEKANASSSLPALTANIKKLVFFSKEDQLLKPQKSR